MSDLSGCGKARLSVFIAVVAAIFLGGCAKTMTLDEAKRYTLARPKAATPPPPRTIRDILAVLEPSGEAPKPRFVALKTKADASPPTDAGDGTLAKFLDERGEAARQLGRYRQALEDLRAAADRSRRTGAPDHHNLRRLGLMELISGNALKAVDLFQESLRIRPDTSTYHSLVIAYTSLGDLDRAEATRRKGIDFCATVQERTRTNPAWTFTYTWALIDEAAMNAYLLEAKGRYEEAERYRRDQLKWALSLTPESPYHVVNFWINLARNLLDQRRRVDAEAEMRKALRYSLEAGGRDSVMTGVCAGVLARALHVQGRTQDAEKLARAALDILESSGVSGSSIYTGRFRMYIGNILAVREDFAGASEQFDKAREAFRENPYLYETGYFAYSEVALALVKTGRSKEALEAIAPALERAKAAFGEKHYRACEWLGLRGMANASAGYRREALADFKVAVPVLMEELSGTSPDFPEMVKIRLVLEAYLDLLADLNGTSLESEAGLHAAAEAFRVADFLAERGKTREALSASGARAAVMDPVLADLVRREQDARREVSSLQTILGQSYAAPRDQQDPKTFTFLQERIRGLGKAIETLRNEVRARFPKYAEFIDPRPGTLETARRSLRPGEALLLVYALDGRTLVWAVPQKGDPAFHAPPLGAGETRKRVARLRGALEPGAGTLGEIPEFDVALAHSLYRDLIKPLEGSLKDSRNLLAVVHGPLDKLPLSVLPTSESVPGKKEGLLFEKYRKVPWLVRTWSVTMLPSVSSLAMLRSLPPGATGRKAFAGFGAPDFRAGSSAVVGAGKTGPVLASSSSDAGQRLRFRGVRITGKGTLDGDAVASASVDDLDPLPDTAEEVREEARFLGADPLADVFLGEQASEERVKTMTLADRTVLSFATHALVPGDLDGLDQPALALAPSRKGGGEDGLLTAGEILGLTLSADWVILSACNTAAADGEGAEALSGLVRAFFYAGSRSVFASLYPVETTSARNLFVELFRTQREEKGLSRSQALRASMISLIDGPGMKEGGTERVVASYAHPLFWAPFVVIGDPG